MGFWDSFLGHSAANAYSQMKKEEQENKRWNDLFYELSQYEQAFTNYLESIGCPALYISDVEAVNNGNIAPEKRKMDNYKRKINEFISLGGQAKYINDLDEIDNEIETIKYLKKMGCLHRQEEFIGLGLYLTQSQIERETREDNGIQILLNDSNNELYGVMSKEDMGFVEYDDNSGEEVLKIDLAKVYDAEINDLLQFKTISVKFTPTHIYVYDGNEHTQIYYKASISSTQMINVFSSSLPGLNDWGLIQVNGLQILASLEYADKLKKFYEQHNDMVVEENIQSQENNESESSISANDIDFSDLGDGYKINNVRVWDEDEQTFYDTLYALKFNYDRVEIYVDESKVAGVKIPKDGYINTMVFDLEADESKKIVRFIGSVFVMDAEDAKNFQEYYNNYDNIIDEVMQKKQIEINEISNEIDGLDNMAINALNMVDEKIMLNHDIVIMMQTLWAYNKYRNVKILDEDATSDENQLMGVMSIKQCIDNMIEIIQEESSLSEEQIRFACWEAIKRVSVKFYSDIWEDRYGKYIDEPLKQCETTQADGTLDRYIENIILCNEIDDSDPWVMCIFTYYMMDKGYTSGELYYPPYFEIVVGAFSTIRENLNKNKLKEKLKGTVQKQETHYTIYDVDMMNGSEFEYFVCELYKKMGYKAEVTKQSGDQGLDVIVEKGDKRIGVQAKCYSGTVGNSAVQEAVAGKNYYHCDKVVVVTNNYFTPSAKELAHSNDVVLWDRDILKEKIKEIM